jgi:hypothetical protein
VSVEERAVREYLLLDEGPDVRDHERPAKRAAVINREEVVHEDRTYGGDLAPRVWVALVRRDEKGVVAARGRQRGLL